MMLGYRSNDAVLTICQNNHAKSIEIQDVNKAAEELIGYTGGELTGKPLGRLVPPRIAEMLSEYVEYENDANDVGMVLSKVQSFSIIGRDGKENGYRLKVVRAESDGNSQTFKLVLQDRAGLRKNEALRKAIQENFRGHEVIDPDTGLPDRYSLARDVELMGHYHNKGDMRSCFAALQLDHYDSLFSQYGRGACAGVLGHVASIARQSLRPDDVVGGMNYKRVGVLLLDTTPESARLVFNRLRWQIAANPYLLPDRTSIGLSVSISFGKIGGRVGERSLVDACDSALDALGAAVTNALVEVDDAARARVEGSAAG